MVNTVTGAPPRPQTAGAGDANLKQAAQEFEAIFLEMLFKQMRSANAALSGESKSSARSTYEGWQDQELARSMSRQGSLGLGEILYKQLQQQAATGKA